MANNTPGATDTIKVKTGQGAIRYYTVVPKKPVNGVAQDWEVTAVDGSPAGLVSEVEIKFKNTSSTLQAYTEKAILVYVMDNSNSDATGEFWQFANGGIQVNEVTGDRASTVTFNVLDNGAALQVEVIRPTVGEDGMNYRFVGACTDATSGEVGVFASSDPSYVYRRL